MTSNLYKTALFTLAVVATACADDDSRPPRSEQPDGSMDVSMDASDPHDANGRDGDAPDASELPDAAIDPDASGEPDAGDAAVCEEVREPYFEDGDVVHTPFRATRVPLAALCGRDGCPTLAQFAARYDCTELEGDASIADFDFEDAGVVESCCFNWWIRTEGCGQVQYRSYRTWPRLRNFDAETGELIGIGQLDDVTEEIAGCVNAAFVGGTLLHDCANVTESVCDRLE